MRLLVLGGTSFVGRHLVHAALAAGMDVTLFNRGQTNPGLFSDLERIVGDRENDLDKLRNRPWDAVVDVNGYLPRIVGATVNALAKDCGHYTFISTVSVYGDVGTDGPDEQSPVATLKEDTEEITGETYGPLKAQCEAFVREAVGDRALIVRPGLVVGPHDPTERFVRWIRRTADGGDVLAPGDPGREVQFIDARDLADWTVRQIVARATGTFNAVGPAEPLTMGTLLETCVDVTGADATLTWVPEQFLLDAGVAPWADLPLWLTEGDNGLERASNRRAVEAGLTFRPLDDTVRATLRWDSARPDRRQAGMDVARERDLLAAWRQSQTT
jgi:2'-hydroxyisoflavone reductase